MPVLPWWAVCYLITVIAFFIIGIVSEAAEDRVTAFGSFMSLVCIISFVAAYFNPFIADRFGILFFPMVLIGVTWEFLQSLKYTGLAQEELSTEHDLSEPEKNFLINMATGLNAFLVVPGYVAGMKICYDMILSGG